MIWLYDLVADQHSYVSPPFLPTAVFGLRRSSGKNSGVPDAGVGRGNRSPAAGGLGFEYAAGNRSRQRVVVEVEQKRKEGGFVPTEIVASLLSDAGASPLFTSWAFRATSPRAQARTRGTGKFNTQLEQQVEARTAELAARNRDIEALVESIPDTVLLCDERGELVTAHFAENRVSSFLFATAGGGDGLSNQHPILLDIARELHTVAWASQQAIMLEFDRNINGADYSIEAPRDAREGSTPAPADSPPGYHRPQTRGAGRASQSGARAAALGAEIAIHLRRLARVSHAAGGRDRQPRTAGAATRHKLTEAFRLELLSRAQRSLGRLTTIMDNVLQLSRADSGRVKVGRMAVDLVQIVQDLIREVEAGDRHSHAFAFQFSGKGDAVPVDTNLLNHILSNLLGNAVRYSPAGTKISVTLDLGEQAFSFTIADEGIGVPEAERERVFEPFARGSNVGQINGTGLGLNIVKRSRRDDGWPD